MKNPLYAMDTHFFTTIGSYSFDVRCQMLKELGYDATYLTLWTSAAWESLSQVQHVQQRHGLSVAAVYATWVLSEGAQSPGNARIVRLAETLQGCDTIELAFARGDKGPQPSDPGGDGAAVRAIDRLLRICERRGIRLLLYPHITFWLERIGDAVRLCRRVAHPQLGAVFCGYHWYAADGKDIAARLTSAAPYLRHANLCGTRRVWGKDGASCSIEPLDDGEMDNFAVLGLLHELGFQGAIGIQGYGVGGDVYTKLKRSRAAYCDMTDRINEHPHWAAMQPTVPWM